MNLLNRMMSYDKTKNENQECNCEECVSVENAELENQIIEYPKLSEEEIEQIINERYSYKDEKTKTFIRKALKVHGDRYDYSNVVYVKNKVYVEIICKVEGHEPFPQKPNNHLQKQGCPICGKEKQAKNHTLTTKEFIERANEVHGIGTYDYSKVNYINMYTDVIITCPIHGDFPQEPLNHLSGRGCKLCGYIKSSKTQRLTLEKFIEKANEVHGKGTYDYSKVEYINNNTEIIITCPKHGDFPQTPHNHLNGEGCSKCTNNYKGENIVRKFLIEQGIKFEEQKTFDFCKDKNKLRFDFYINQYNLCIEYDGIQHFIPRGFCSNILDDEIEEKFKYTQKHDKIKNEYCKNNNINLLRIRYDEDIEKILTECFQNNKIIKE